MEHAVMRRTALRVGAVLAAATLAVFALAAPAGAHVTVSAASATQGGYTKATFRVPNEKASASTVKVEVNLPTDTPIASVSTKPIPGWTAVTEKTKLPTPINNDDGDEITEAITKITWTADANAGIQAGQFQEFDVSMGPLPDTDQVVFKTLQTYSDGDIVRWIDEPKNDGTEAEHPAPTLRLAKGTSDGTDTGAASEEDSSGSGWGVGLGLTGAALGLAGLVVALLAYRRTDTRV
jgi:uncharacterized protein YcnI